MIEQLTDRTTSAKNHCHSLPRGLYSTHLSPKFGIPKQIVLDLKTMQEMGEQEFFGLPLSKILAEHEEFSSAVFEEFAKSKGHEVDNGVVLFGQDEAAAQAFDQEAYKAGFQTVVGITQAKWTDGKEDSSN